MTKYKLTRQHFIVNPENPQAGPLLHEAGTEVEWDDKEPTLGMEGLDEEGRKKCKERAAQEKEKRERAAHGAPPGRSTTIMDTVVPRADEEQPQQRRRGR